MSVDHRDAVWPQKDNFIKEDYLLTSETSSYPRACIDGSNREMVCKNESYIGGWTNTTPIKDSSPSSTEPTSMLSDKSSSRGTFETKNSEHTCFSTDTGDTEHPISEGSLSPQPSCIPESQNINTHCSSQNVKYNFHQDCQTPGHFEGALSHRPVSRMGSNQCFSSAPSRPPNFNPTDSLNDGLPSSGIPPTLPNYGYPQNYQSFQMRTTSTVNNANFSSPDRSMHPQYRPYATPSPYFNIRKANGYPFPEEYAHYSRCPSSEIFYPGYSNTCQPTRSLRPTNPYSSYLHQRHYTPSPLDETLDMKSRYEMQQCTYQAPTAGRFPTLTGQDYCHQMPDRVRQPPYAIPDSCAYPRPTHGFADSIRCHPEYRNGPRARFPRINHPLPPNPYASNLFAPPYSCSHDAPNYVPQTRPQRPPLDGLKKRNAPTSNRTNKRRRTAYVNDEKTGLTKSSVDVHASLALSCLLSLNVSSCVSTPALENPVDVNPPKPALRKSTCHLSGSTLLQRTIDNPLDFSKYARKYTSFLFNLRLNSTITQEDLLSFLNKGEQYRVDLQRNGLVKAFTSAISRLTSDENSDWYTAPPSPSTNGEHFQDPLCLFVRKRSDASDSDKFLFEPKRRRIAYCGVNDANRPAHTNLEVPTHRSAREVYAETRVSLEALVSASTCNVCRNCGMQVFSPDGNLPLTTSPPGTFCSQSCRSKYAAMLKQRVGRPPANSLSNLLYSDPVISQVPILIKGAPSKLCKQQLKTSSIGKVNRRHQREFSAAAHVRRWQGSRWTSFSSSKHPPCVSGVEDEMPTVSNWLRPLLGGNQVTSIRDTRSCELCNQTSDADEPLAGRLLNYTCDKWIHVNCVLWCYEAYETLDGCLMNVEQALEKARHQRCTYCKSMGAGVPCFAVGCPLVYHVQCAYTLGCSFHEDRSMFCLAHLSQAPRSGKLENLKVSRRVYLSRDEYDLVADVIGTQCLAEMVRPRCFRVGTLILNSIGQLLPEHLEGGRFHNQSFIYPVGFSTTRIYWSYQRPGQRCRYTCTIVDSATERSNDCSDDASHANPSPIFSIKVTDHGFPEQHFRAGTCREVWRQILNAVRDARKRMQVTSLTLFPNELLAEDLFGLSEPHIVRAVESLPGVEHLRGYVFKFGKMQLITKMPLVVNPSGCARSEPKLRTYIRSRNRDVDYGNGHQKRSTSMSSPPHLGFLRPLHQILRTSSPCPTVAPTGKQSSPIMSKYQQYRCLKFEWKNNVILARSKIQGLGLFAARDIEKHEFIIEYLGQMIRNEVGNRRERLYDSQNRGIYMFRADDECIVDATMYGGLARYINHSCEPNCIAEVFAFEAYKRIIIIAKRFIKKGEELTYDYKFDFEDDKPSRIPCLCGAQFCRKWMN